MRKHKGALELSPTMQRAFDSFAIGPDGRPMVGASNPRDDERFYAFVRVCHHHRRRLSEIDVSQLLLGVGFPEDEANEWGAIFHHCYGVLSTPLPQYAISREHDEILRSLKSPYQGPSSRGVSEP